MGRSLSATAIVLAGLVRTPLAAGNASNGGWYEQVAKCASSVETLCGDGCTVDLGTCKDGQCHEFITDNPIACGPATKGCEDGDSATSDGGCCPASKLLGEPGTCVEATCQNQLQYGCEGYNTSSAPTCAVDLMPPAGLGANGTVTKCTRGSAACYAFIGVGPTIGTWPIISIIDDNVYITEGCDGNSPILSGAAGISGLMLPALGLLPFLVQRVTVV